MKKYLVISVLMHMYIRGLIIQTRSIFASGIHGGLSHTYILIYFKSQLIEHSLRFFEIELNRSCFTDRWWSFCPKSIHVASHVKKWPSHQIHSSSPLTYTERWREKYSLVGFWSHVNFLLVYGWLCWWWWIYCCHKNHQSYKITPSIFTTI